MSTDSYSEIMEMQKQALSRAKNISNQERRAVKNENMSQDVGQYNYTPREPKHTSLPVNIPKKEPVSQNAVPLSTPETDRAMLLSILLLLKNEGADEMLMLALLYILA